MRLTLDREYEYIPEWNNNKAEQKPIKFVCKYLNSSEVDRCMKIGSVIEIDRGRYFETSLVRIENLEIGEKPVCTAKEFRSYPQLSSLYSEVVTEMIGRNSYMPSKN